ncbi:autotransporter outer membrane beta-barrel domain-containing protein [Legionella fallonii]|uniref:Autotransporter domain-containing protein n=1 Tax=Legionella fallonii LLAP-10 TaxID=1212491 RepID=A0A098G3Z9_9GAMM|nr:autotransporter outer membrane beta-barrel domain-containing protein [Legionella fallonii]CEG57202.1 conserved exported protein of unknown function [Legionella fallonii LLAP-10]
MERKALVISSFLAWSCSFAYAVTPAISHTNQPQKASLNSASTNAPMFKRLIPKFLYSYIDFNFDSTTGPNFNRFQGHSNLYSAGADHIILAPNLFAGLYLFDIETSVDSQTVLGPAGLVLSHTNIKNNTIFGHILKAFNQNFYIDSAGAYGQNNISGVTQLTPKPILGISSSTNHNWFYSVNGIYRKNWRKVLIKASTGILFNRVKSDTSYMFFQTENTPQMVKPLTNRATYVMENLELGYSLSRTITPFINGGLIQVADFANSRPIVNTVAIIGALPQLQLNQNAYRLGGGISLKLKLVTLRLEQKYYNAGGTFTSNDTLINLSCPFS